MMDQDQPPQWLAVAARWLPAFIVGFALSAWAAMAGPRRPMYAVGMTGNELPLHKCRACGNGQDFDGFCERCKKHAPRCGDHGPMEQDLQDRKKFHCPRCMN